MTIVQNRNRRLQKQKVWLYNFGCMLRPFCHLSMTSDYWSDLFNVRHIILSSDPIRVIWNRMATGRTGGRDLAVAKLEQPNCTFQIDPLVVLCTRIISYLTEYQSNRIRCLTMHSQNNSRGNFPIQFPAVLQPFWPTASSKVQVQTMDFSLWRYIYRGKLDECMDSCMIPEILCQCSLHPFRSALHATSHVKWLWGEHASTSDTQCPVIIHQIREGNKHDSILIIALEGVLFWQDKLASSVRDSGASWPSKFASVTGMVSPAAVAVAESLVAAGNSAFFLLNSWTTCKKQIHLEYMNFHRIMS